MVLRRPGMTVSAASESQHSANQEIADAFGCSDCGVISGLQGFRSMTAFYACASRVWMEASPASPPIRHELTTRIPKTLQIRRLRTVRPFGFWVGFNPARISRNDGFQCLHIKDLGGGVARRPFKSSCVDDEDPKIRPRNSNAWHRKFPASYSLCAIYHSNRFS